MSKKRNRNKHNKLSTKEPTKQKEYIALLVYGTLRKAGYNHEYFLADAVFSQKLIVSGVKLYEINMLPVAVLTNKNKNKLYAELYYIDKDNLKFIDTLEQGYKKVKISLAIRGYKSKQTAIMYVKTSEDVRKARPYRIKSGDWIEHEQAVQTCIM